MFIISGRIAWVRCSKSNSLGEIPLIMGLLRCIPFNYRRLKTEFLTRLVGKNIAQRQVEARQNIAAVEAGIAGEVILLIAALPMHRNFARFGISDQNQTNAIAEVAFHPPADFAV